MVGRTATRHAALTFVVDVSGSMGEPGKLDLVKSALHTLIEQLRPTDSRSSPTTTPRGHCAR